MRAEIINVGTELLLGGIVNLNSRYLSEELASLGIGVYYQTSVGDNPVRLKKVLAAAVSRSSVIIITGGLGPTADDITKETVSAALNIPLVEDAVSLDRIEKYFASKGTKMPEANRKQALCPRGAVIFKNTAGTAPGYALSAGKQHILMLPGPPSELKAMFEDSVRDYLAKLSDGVILSKEVRIFGMGESEVAEKVEDLLQMANPTVAPYAKNGEVELRVTAKAESTMKAHGMCMQVVDDICARLGDKVYTCTHANLQETVVAMLKEKNLGLSTAESCTAGLLSSRITEVPGASQVFNFGIVAYANEIKQELLGVRPETLEKYGAVSEQTALEMAAGARKKGKTKLGVAITGVAGPQGSESKPVGLVYVALCDEKQYWCRELNLGHKATDRDAIRNLSAMNALDMARIYLGQYPKVSGGIDYSFEEEKVEEPTVVTPVTEKVADISLGAMNITNDEFVMVVEDTPDNNSYFVDSQAGEYNFVGYDAPEEEDTTPRKGILSGLFGRLSKKSEPVEETIETVEDEPAEETESVADVAEEETLPEAVTSEDAEEEAADSVPNEAIEEEPKITEEAEPETVEVEEEAIKEEIIEEEIIEEDLIAEEEPDVLDDETETEDSDPDLITLTDEEEEDDPLEEKGNVFKRIVKTVIPGKGDRPGEIIRKCVFLLALIVFVGSAVYLISFFSDQSRNNRLINNVREQWNEISSDTSVNEDGYLNRFQFLIEQNPDTFGWIKIKNTNVDNPVYQSDDITYYEKHNMAGEPSRYGALFAHPDCYLDAETTARNITIYGHNTQDGSMFGTLKDYRRNGFFKRSPIIEFDSIYREGEYKIFAVMIVNAYPGQDNGRIYDYARTSFSSDLDFELWIDEARKRSMYNTGIDVNADDEILTLSTCVYDFYEARLVIMARRVRPGESLKIDTSVVKDNGSATYYPAAYYESNDHLNLTQPDYFN